MILFNIIMSEDYDPFLDAFNSISKDDNKKNTNNQNQSTLDNNQNIGQKNSNPSSNIELNEQDEENKMDGDQNENNKNQNEFKNEKNNTKKDDNLEQTFLGQKTKPEEELDSIQFSSINKNISSNNNNNNSKSEVIKEYTSISAFNNNDNKPLEEYDYGYTIILLKEGETGLMEDFLNEKPNESTTSDFFNFHLDEEKWIKILNHSILVHYERHIKELKEEFEKRKKLNNLMGNVNGSANTQMIPQINPMNSMMMGYQQMYLQNLKNMQLMAMQNK